VVGEQTFKDYILAKGDGCSDDCRYRLLAVGVAAASRLPPEAIECAIMFLESNSDQDACVLAVRLNRTESSLATTWQHETCQPIAIVARKRSSSASFNQESLGITNYENLLSFADQIPGSTAGWKVVEICLNATRTRSLRDRFDPQMAQLWVKNCLARGLRGYLVHNTTIFIIVCSFRNRRSCFEKNDG
jgi:hypothetical protein